MSRLESLKALVDQDPFNCRVRFMLAMEHMNSSDWSSALSELTEIITREPSYLSAYFQAGRAAEQLGMEDAARGFYRRGIPVAQAAANARTASELQAALDILGG